MSGLTWLYISGRLWRREKELDRQVIRAAPISDIGGPTAIGQDLSMLDFIISSSNMDYIGRTLENEGKKRSFLYPLLKVSDVGLDGLFRDPGAVRWLELFLKNFRLKSGLLDPTER